MEEIYNEYKSNPKITIVKVVKGKRGFDAFVKAIFSERGEEEGAEWATGFTSEQKRKCIFFTYKRFLIKNYKVGAKLIIDMGNEISVLGEERHRDA